MGILSKDNAQSKREQDLLHEELADREWALRDTRIKWIHEMEELKRTHELRVDEFSGGKLIEHQKTINELAHGQGTGITKWDQLYEWCKRF